MLRLCCLGLLATTIHAWGQTCLAVNNTKCTATNKGACREDCNPDPAATEGECLAKGCCWQEVRNEDGTPTEGYPWCFFPGYSPKCVEGQVAKDKDQTVYAAAQAYHAEGSQATADAYRTACLARGDHFFSFFVTPVLWVDVASSGDGDGDGDGPSNPPSWQSTHVSLVKYGCNSAACSADDIKHITHRIQEGQQQVNFSSGIHSSFKFNVTGYTFEAPGDTVQGGTSSGSVVLIVVVAVALAALAVGVGYFWRRYQALKPELDMEAGQGYHRKDSFPAADDMQPKPAAAIEPGTPESPRSSLVNNQM